MKGFVKILEVVIAAVILISSMSFFSAITFPDYEWDDLSIRTTSHDILMSLHTTGELGMFVDNNDVGMYEVISNALPKSIDFSIIINGLPDNEITIGCVCDNDELINLQNMLSTTINLKGRNVTFNVKLDSLAGINNDTEILFIYGYGNLETYRASIENFLSNGGSIILWGDVTDIEISNDAILRDIFGLKWFDANPSSQNGFYDMANPYNNSYKIDNYFRATGIRIENNGDFYVEDKANTVRICTDTDGSKYVKIKNACNPTDPGEPKNREGDVFEINANSVKVYLIDTYAMMGIVENDYNFKKLLGNGIGTSRINQGDNTVIINSNSLSGIVANVTGGGKVAWISNYDIARTDFNQLTTSILFWAGERPYTLNPEPQTPRGNVLEVDFISPGTSEFQPFIVTLSIWRVFY